MAAKTATPPAGPISFTETVTPGTQAEVVELVRSANADDTPVYPLGGRTALGYGLATKQPGLGLVTTGLNRVVDYPARDMTITVEAGTTFAQLAETLAAENQYLPVEIAAPQTATLGGAIAVNMSGPRRYGYGTLRDYVIGISAVDGRGTPFHAGGRVVKNVAGYDFCKLLTGSLGTLGVITQVTLKVRPRPAAAAIVVYGASNFTQADRLLEAVTTTKTTPVAVELLSGPAWSTAPVFAKSADSPITLAVGFEGTQAEVDWQIAQLDREWQPLGGRKVTIIVDHDVQAAWQRLAEFGCGANPAPLVLKISARPSRQCELLQRVAQLLPESTILGRAGNGIALVDCGDLAAHEAVKLLLRDLRPAASAASGHIVVWNTPSPEEWTRAAFWGPTREDDVVMRTVKQQFDPKNLLNPGRFLF